MTVGNVTASIDDQAAFSARLAAFEGREVGPAFHGLDAVNVPMIRHWCDAMGDANPVYTDPDAADTSVHGGIVAPPTMLQTWGMWGYRPRPRTGETPQDELLGLLESHGFTSVVATDCEQEYARELRPGDEVTVRATIESVSTEKQTALGTGHFVTTKQAYLDAEGHVVATMLFRILKFRPGTGKGAGATTADAASLPEPPSPEPPPRRPLRPRPSLTKDNAWWFDALREHRLLIQRCASCGALRHPPRPMCERCGTLDWDTADASGRGTVYSFVVNHYPQVPAFDYPLVVALVELAEGTRLVANMTGVEATDVGIGMAVEAEFVDHDPDLTLVAFHPAAGG